MALLVSEGALRDYVLKVPDDRSEEATAALLALAEAVSDWIEARCGPVLHVDVAERHDGGTSRIFLRRRPVAQVLRVAERGVELASDAYALYGPEGILVRLEDGRESVWAKGPQAVEVVYRAGRAATVEEVPSAIRGAVLRWTYELWHSQAGNVTGQVDEMAAVRNSAPPADVLELLRPYMQVRMA